MSASPSGPPAPDGERYDTRAILVRLGHDRTRRRAAVIGTIVLAVGGIGAVALWPRARVAPPVAAPEPPRQASAFVPPPGAAAGEPAAGGPAGGSGAGDAPGAADQHGAATAAGGGGGGGGGGATDTAAEAERQLLASNAPALAPAPAGVRLGAPPSASGPRPSAPVPQALRAVAISSSVPAPLWVDDAPLGLRRRIVVRLTPGEHRVKARFGRRTVLSRIMVPPASAADEPPFKVNLRPPGRGRVSHRPHR